MSKIYFVITIDTEEEWNWGEGFPVKSYTTENGKSIPKFQKFCNELQIKPTYLVDYAIASDRECVKNLREPFEAEQCEIGGHLHPWCTPPVKEEINSKNSHIVNLPLELVQQKLANLTNKLKQEFGHQPTSFRAGRWGMNGNLLKLLAENGYTIDTSIRPFHEDSGFSYQKAMEIPYWPDFKNCLKIGEQRDIYEMPASTGFNVKNFKLANKLLLKLRCKPFTYFHLIGILDRSSLLRKVMLCPEKTGAKEMISCIHSYLKRKNIFLNMNFHSSTLMPGGSPYVSNENEEKAFYKSIREVVDYARSKAEVCFCSLSEAKKYCLNSFRS